MPEINPVAPGQQAPNPTPDQTPKPAPAENNGATPNPTPTSAVDPKAGETPKPAETPKPEAKGEGTPKPDTKTDPNAPKNEIVLKAPEGSHLDAKAIEGIAAFAKEQGLSQTQADKLLLRENEAVARFVEGQNEKVKEVAQQWIEAVATDAELGGEKLSKSLEDAKRFINCFGNDQLKRELHESQLGNHPEFVRLCAKAGAAMAQDKAVIPGAQAGGEEKKSIAEHLYGKPEAKAT